MNYRFLAKFLGLFSLASAGFIAPSALWAIWFREWACLGGLIASMLAAAFVGGILYVLGRNAEEEFYQREALGLVAMGWILVCALGALPFVTTGVLGPVDAFFESVSGYTTTGSTVIVDIEATPKSVLFWRSFTHWLGGMGIVLLFIAVLPYLGAGGKQLFKRESTGPDVRGFTPRIRDTASSLYKIYLGFTVAQTVLLMLAGMNLFEALCHTFGTLATGGFSTRQASVAAYDSLAIEVIIIVFMLMCGTNFALYFAMLQGDWRALWRSTEWRVFMAIFVVSTALVTINLIGVAGRVEFDPPTDWGGGTAPAYPVAQALRVASFQVASLMTDTGFATDDFDRWPYFSRFLLLCLIIVGGCAGSTSGGLKVVRFIMLVKMIYWRIESTFRPKTVRPVRIGDQIIDDATQRNVYAFFVLYIGILTISTLLLSWLGLPLDSALSAVVATMNNAGPGLEYVGAIRDFHLVPDLGKLLLCFCMIAGRLELLTLCVLLVPAFWRHS